jgi:diguanylate cyclase (GGDEF)-like protein
MSADLERYTELLHLMPLGALLVEDGVIRHVSPSAVATMGIPAERMIGIPLAELLVPDFEATCVDVLERAGERPESVAVRLASGLMPLELTVRSLPDRGAIVGVRSMLTEHHYSALAGGELTHDSVTGLPNHYHVLSELKTRLAAPKRLPLALMCLWVDELGSLGEIHGQRAVQRIMKEVAGRIQEKLRAPDILGRFEDAGFLVLMTSDSSPDQLTEVASRLRAEVAFPVELDHRLVSFTASVVVGSIIHRQPSIERVLAHLEAAANRAANSGGNRTDVLAL